MEELNSGPPKTNPSSGREEDLNPGPPDYKSSALTTRPRCLLNHNKDVMSLVLERSLYSFYILLQQDLTGPRERDIYDFATFSLRKINNFQRNRRQFDERKQLAKNNLKQQLKT